MLISHINDVEKERVEMEGNKTLDIIMIVVGLIGIDIGTKTYLGR